jgi:hypothetical protein
MDRSDYLKKLRGVIDSCLQSPTDYQLMIRTESGGRDPNEPKHVSVEAKFVGDRIPLADYEELFNKLHADCTCYPNNKPANVWYFVEIEARGKFDGRELTLWLLCDASENRSRQRYPLYQPA